MPSYALAETQVGEASQGRVCYQRGLPHLVLFITGPDGMFLRLRKTFFVCVYFCAKPIKSAKN